MKIITTNKTWFTDERGVFQIPFVSLIDPLADISFSMRFHVIVFFFFLSSKAIFGQCDKDLKMFNHYTVVHQKDTVRFHVFLNGPQDSISNVLLFSHGSGAFPLYQIKRNDDGFWMKSRVPISTTKIPNNYAFVLISKPGIPFCTHLDSDFVVPDKFLKKETLDNRVIYSNVAINFLIDSILKRKIQKVVILGHSEGSDVVAKLGTINKRVTHIGYLSGGGNSQFFDFPLMIRKQMLEGKITDVESIKRIDSILEKYKEIVPQKDSIYKTWQGNTYQRWYSFAEPPIENLMKIDIPIYMAIGSGDKAVPIESAYLIPVEFIRKGKTNLTFKIYPGLSHNFSKTLNNGQRESHWEEVFDDFLNWVNAN